MFDKAKLIQNLRQSLPATFGRKWIQQQIGGILSSRTLANLDSLGLGPPHKYISNKVIYERESFLIWLAPRLTDQPGRSLSKPSQFSSYDDQPGNEVRHG